MDASNTAHHWVPVRWSLVALRQIAGQEIARVTGDARWRDPLPGSWETWSALHEIAREMPRIGVWEGPWLLFSDPPVCQAAVQGYGTAPPEHQMAIREALWFWSALQWGAYAHLATWAVVSYMIEVWPPGWWETLGRCPSRPVRDWLRLERRVMYLRVAIEGAAQGQSRVRWGRSWIDTSPFQAPGRHLMCSRPTAKASTTS